MKDYSNVEDKKQDSQKDYTDMTNESVFLLLKYQKTNNKLAPLLDVSHGHSLSWKEGFSYHLALAGS